MNTFVKVDLIERIIGYSFKNKEYPILAFTHSSYANENGCDSNERIEFLGDSILNFVVAEMLFLRSGEKEGKLSRKRANVVSEEPLADAVRDMGLDTYLLAGRSLEQITDAVRADLFEAVVGAIYLDGGMDKAKQFILDKLADIISSKGSAKLDFKSTLYELAQEKKLTVRFEEIGRSGPDHSPTFTYAVFVDGNEMGRASAGRKNAAQMKAAEIALGNLRSI